MSLSPTEVVRVHERKYSDLGFSLSQLPVTVTDIFPSPPHLGDFFFFIYLGLFFLMEVGGFLMCFNANQPGWKTPVVGIDLQFIEMSTEGRW